MISGVRSLCRAHDACRVLGLAFFVLFPAHAASDWNLAQLMQTLAQNQPARANFVERKFIALLDRPVESSGELLFVPPDRLEKRTAKPKPESMVLERGQLTIERGKQRMVLALAEHPEVAAFTESIRGTLAGDQPALERVYRLKLEGAPERWQLTLQPIEAKLAAVVSTIEIGGTRNEVRTVEIVQSDGDRSVMTIQKASAP